MLAFAAGTLFLTIWYLLFSLSPWIVFLVAGVALSLSAPALRRIPLRMPGKPDPYTFFLFLGVLIGDGLLLRTFFLARTTDALASPWNVLPTAVFFLFFVTSFFLLLLSREKNRALPIVASSIHLLTAFSVASIVYGVGFGFDAFLHRAAEQALLETGSILPKTPLYTGQYVLVTSLAHLTRLPVKLIDIWLVPVMASIILPLDFKKLSPFLLLFPFAALTFTVPYNLTVVYALWLIAAWVQVRVDARLPHDGGQAKVDSYHTAGMVTLAMLGVFTHPLLGLPMAVVTGYVIFVGAASRARTSHFAYAIVAVISVGLSVPALMFVYNHLQGVPLAATNPLTRLDLFTGLFKDPFPPAFGPHGRRWDLFYSWNLTLPLIFSLVTLPFAFFGQELEKPQTRRLGILALGIFIIAFLLSTLFVFKDVIVFEQFEYSLRLIHVIPLLLSPLAGVLISKLLDKTKSPIITMAIMALCALAMTASWYFSYPQENPKVQIGGPSVSAADIQAVHRIDKDAAGEPYIVLSNQMTSAAAIQEFGFRDYVKSDAGEILWYAIPTGGSLYSYFSEMTYYQPRRDIAEDAATFAHVNTVYYLVYQYWPGYEYIADLAGKDADTIIRMNKGDILLFKFTVKK